MQDDAKNPTKSPDPDLLAPEAAPPERAPFDAVKAVAEPRADAAEADAIPEDAPPAEPDDYGEFDWPEGYVADPAALARFVPVARKLGLPKEGAQELARLYADLDRERREAEAGFIAKNNAEWLAEIRSHPEFGGGNLERTGREVAAMIRRYGSPLLTAQIRQMNVQNWPEMFYFLARVAQASGEDCSPSGVAAAPVPSTAQLLFPGLN